MSRYYEDVLKQPAQLISSLRYHTGEGKVVMKEAFRVLSYSRHVFIVGIGASWNAGLAVQYSLNRVGISSQLCDAAEFYHHIVLPKQSVVLFLSRSGKSVEIVNSITKCREAGATIIAITNDPGSPLGKGADYCLHTSVEFDHAISVNTYSSIILTGHLLAQCGDDAFFHSPLIHGMENALSAIHEWIPACKQVVGGMEWSASSFYYFLARGNSQASAFESALLWEEAAKYPATAMSTGTFRHGPQEIIGDHIDIILWIDPGPTQEYDWRLAADLQQAGVQVTVIGNNTEHNTSLQTIEVPVMPQGLEPLVNIIPMQLAAERFAKSRGEDSDGFRYCSLVVEKEGGL